MSTLDFRKEVGDIADVISYGREFLGRTVIDKSPQEETLIAACGKEPYEWNLDYHELALVIGMKGGKNFIAEWITSYLCYKISSMVDPHSYFTKVTGRRIRYSAEKNFDIVNVSSVDERQARTVFFETIGNVLRGCRDPKTGDRWFERFAGLDVRGGGIGDVQGKMIKFPTDEIGKGTIRLLSFNSTATAPEGIHCLMFLADELSRADTRIKKNEAEKLLKLGINNTKASFPRNVGKVMEWSYPNDTDYDLTYERLELSYKFKHIFGKKYTTFEYNPTLSKDMFADQYLADPIGSACTYECIKPISRDNFYQPHVNKIEQVVNPKIGNKVNFRPERLTRPAQGKDYYFSSIEVTEIIGDNRERCFTHDASVTGDRYFIVGGYNETIDEMKIELFLENRPEVIYTNKKPIIDILIVIEPIDGNPVDYLAVGELFTKLIIAFPNTRSINSDKFQNEKLRQEFIAKGIRAETYFFSRAQQMRLYVLKRSNIWNNNLEICQDGTERIHMGSQKLTLSELWVHESKKLEKDGDKIDHPEGGSKDISDCIAICHQDLIDLETKGNMAGIENLAEPKLLTLVERYMIERQRLRNNSVIEADQTGAIAAALTISLNDCIVLKRYVNDTFPNT